MLNSLLQILVKIFSFLDPRFLIEIVSEVSSKFSLMLHDENYWKFRIHKQWAYKYPPITPTIPLRWVECAIEREEMVKRFRTGAKNFQSIIVPNTHYSSCDTILMLPIPNRYLAISGSRDRSLVLWDVKGYKHSNESAWSRVVSKNSTAHDVSETGDFPKRGKLRHKRFKLFSCIILAN